MNIHELDSYNLSDAVRFHRRLNPRIWGRDEHLLPEVREKLLAIAEDFQEFLGVADLDVKDITISGSNAAYSYTKNSDIDLHLVVTMLADPVYQELFNAKKYQWNDEHNIKIGGADVELYVQPADQPHISQGIYSVKNNKWISIPKRKRAQIDDACVRDKVADLDARIHDAVRSGNEDKIATLADKIKAMRQAGLEQHGEFGCENLAFKMLRNSGCIKLLWDARRAAQDRELSLREAPQKKFRYGYGAEVDEASLADMRAAFAADPDLKIQKHEVFGSPYEYEKVRKQREAERQEKIAKIARTPVKPWPMGVKEGHQGQPYSSEDGVAASTKMFCEDNDDENLVHEFIQHTAKELGIDPLPKIQLHANPEWSVHNHSFGRYDPDTHTLNVSMPNRHILDVLRTVAHELVHCSQNQQHGRLPDDAGETGSRWENDANARAGIIMRDWANTHPEHFELPALEENASGYIPKNKREAKMPQYAMALSVDIKPGEVGRQANKLALKTGRNGEPGLLMKTANLRESAGDHETHNTNKLDRVLARCCAMIEKGQRQDPERYGMVAACVIDPDHNYVYGINLPGPDGTRRHAERVALDKYRKQHGDVPEGSIVVTTLSPCNAPMDERAGESCKDLLNSAGIHRVYCGYIDPTQHDDEDADFAMSLTQNDDLWEACKAFADTFLHENKLTGVVEGLEVDVPNENWLADKIDYAQSKGRNRYGVPYMGTTTAYTSQHQRVPVDILRQLPGMRGEQQNVRQQDLEAIINIMKDTGRLPLHQGKEYAPFINVAWNGEAWVNDGNHRIMAAAELGWKDLPVQISYFDGGERVKSGAMYPGRIGLGNIEEARRNPDRNLKYGVGKFELAAFAEDIRDKENWGVSMTAEPKLGINPQVGISEDTPKGIYFYPLEYFIQTINRYQPLPWGDNMPYMQLFQYDRSGEMTQQTKVDPDRLRQALSQYCPEEIIQQVLDEPDSLYDGTPYWMIYDCLSRLGTSDETNIVRWNKVLRDLGFTSVYDPGRGWIAYNEPTQGVVLDPRIIQQHKMFVNRNPTVKARQYDIQRLADAIMYDGDYDRERQRQRIRYGDPAEAKARLDVAKSMLRPFLGKTDKEAKEMGFDQAVKAAGDKVIEILKPSVTENFADGKNPGRKGLAKRVGVNTKASVSSLRKTAKHSSGEKQRMSHWLANMKAGRAKAKKK